MVTADQRYWWKVSFRLEIYQATKCNFVNVVHWLIAITENFDWELCDSADGRHQKKNTTEVQKLLHVVYMRIDLPFGKYSKKMYLFFIQRFQAS